MKNHTLCIAQNLSVLRKHHGYSQEDVAEKIGVSRQAVAKWEIGETTPDLVNCDALADLYNVSVDDLLHFDQSQESVSIPPKGKHLFGAVKVGERGQIVLPKKARDLFGIQPGDLLVVLGDEDPITGGLALMHGNTFLKAAEFFSVALNLSETPNAGPGETR